jgi:nucleoside-diphosphate-sugar epimerase
MSFFLVTGGAGFIGSHIIQELIQRGDDVRVADNFITGKKENIALFEGKIEFLEGDIRDKAFCEKITKDVDFVLHQAALPSVIRSVREPVLTTEINVMGTLNLLIASSTVGVKKFVFASSSSVYGDHPQLPKKEGEEGVPLSPYAASKMTGEMYCRVFSSITDLPTVCLRYFNVFGPRQDPASQYAAAIPIFITRVLEDKIPIIFGDGEQSRDFTFVDNIVKANLMAVQTEGISGEVFNVAGGKRISVNSLAERIIQKLGKDVKPDHDEPRPGDVRHSVADISKAEKMIDYRPVVSFEDGLDRTITWYREKFKHEKNC